MATYAPPSETLPIFNPDVFLTNDAGGDYLDFPVAQGSETFPYGLTASSLTTIEPTTIDSLGMSDLNPQYKIDYPVNSGHIDFFSNTAVGVSTRGGKIDATGVHTISKFDTIDETAGTLNIGTETARTGAINIGTGTTSKSITVGGSAGNTTITGGNALIRPSASGNINIGDSGTSGNINIGRTDSSSSSQAINIGTGSNLTGAINIGTGTTGKVVTINGLASANTTTINGGVISILGSGGQTTNISNTGILNLSNGSSSAMNIGNSKTGGTIDIGQSGAGASTTTVNIATGNNQTGAINIGTGTGTKTVTIGGAAGTTVNLNGVDINASSLDVTGTLTATTFAPATINCDTINGTTMNIQPSAGLNLADTLTTGSINIGRQNATATTTTVNIATGNGQTGTVNIGTGTGTKTMGIGGTNTTLNLVGTVISASNLKCNTFATSLANATASLFGEATRAGNINIGLGTNRTGTINIGNGGGASATGGVSIQTNGTGTVTIGNSGSTTALVGTVDINRTGTGNTRIGNATGTATFTGTANFNDSVSLGATSADSIVPNGTLTKPLIIGTYASQSSFSLSSLTPLTTYLGGTLQTFKSFSNVATGTFNYAMSSVTPYSAGGGIALTAGTYLFFMGINWEVSSSFDMTDLRMGLSDVGSLTSGSNEATLLAAAPNRTVYFHKTDNGNASGGDSENRVISGCFNIASATTMYPWFKANTSVTITLVTVDVIFTKIGSA